MSEAVGEAATVRDAAAAVAVAVAAVDALPLAAKVLLGLLVPVLLRPATSPWVWGPFKGIKC